MSAEAKRPDWIAVGEVLTSQGNKGEVRVKPLTDFPERFQPGMGLRAHYPDGRTRQMTVESVRYHKQFVILKFAGIDDIGAARQLRGVILEVGVDDVVPLPEGRYYVFELIGLRVVEEDGSFLGELVDITPNAANDIYTVRLEDGREVLLPAVKQVIRNIDLETGTITVRLLPGLLD